MSEFTRKDLISDDALAAPGIMTTEFQKLVDQLDIVVKKSQEYVNTLTSQNTSTAKLKESTQGLSDEQKALAQVQTQINTVIAKQSDEYVKQIGVLNNLKQEQKEKVALGNQEAATVTQQANSINQLKAALESNRVAYSNLRTEQERQSSTGKNLLKTIQDQDKSFKNLTSSMGQNQARVGDYKGELSGLLSKFGELGQKGGDMWRVLGETAASSLGVLAAAVSVGAFALKMFFERTEEGVLAYETQTLKLESRWDMFKNKIAVATAATIKFFEADKEYYDYKEKQRVSTLGPEELADYNKQKDLDREITDIVLKRRDVEKEEISLLVSRLNELDKAKKLELEARDSSSKTIKERYDAAVKAQQFYDKVQLKDIELATKKAGLANNEIYLRARGRGLILSEQRAIEQNIGVVTQSQLDYDSSQKRRISYQNDLHKQLIKQMEEEAAKRSSLKYYSSAIGQTSEEKLLFKGQVQDGKDQIREDEKNRVGGVKYEAHLESMSKIDEQFNKTMGEAEKERTRFKEEKDREELERKKEMSKREIALVNTTAKGAIDAVNSQYAYMEEREAHHAYLVQQQYHQEMAIAGDNTQAKIQLTNQFNAAEKKSQHELSELRHKQAEFNRDIALAEIVFNTAKAVTADLENPPKIALDIAIGAAQAASVMAKSLPPVYAEGTDYHPGGSAIIGDNGAELVRFPSGGFSLITEPTLFESAPRGLEVFTNNETLRMLGMSSEHGWKSPSVDKQLLRELKALRQETERNRPINKSLLRDGGVIYEASQVSDTYFKKVRVRNMGKWVK